MQEFHYLPYSFGSGLLAFRVKGDIYKITYDGRFKILTVSKSVVHEIYPASKWTIISELNSLNDETIDEILAIINFTA